MDMAIDACKPPHRLALSAVDDSGGWPVELVLTESAGMTELRFTHHLTDLEGVGEFGAGWELYLDALVAYRDGRPPPTLADYCPAVTEYFEAQR